MGEGWLRAYNALVIVSIGYNCRKELLLCKPVLAYDLLTLKE
jgi:hypothetical protein